MLPQEPHAETLAQTRDNKVVDLPSSRPLRLEQAIAAFDSGDNSNELYQEFESLANAGFSEAYYFLGCMFEDGTNTQARDLTKALALYEKAAGDIGYLEAHLGVARLLSQGNGETGNYERAREIYENILRCREHPVACLMLGRMYQHGYGGVKDLAAAEALYKRAIAKGNVFGIVNLSLLRAEQRRLFESAWLRLKAAFMAYRIARVNKHDARLRGG